MNCAAGLARDGSLIVLASGWSNRPPKGTYDSPHKGEVLPLWVCRSNDGARTWQHAENAVEPPPGPDHPLIPFGMIVDNHDGTLAVSLYGWGADRTQREALVYVSSDDGKTWQLRSVIGKDLNETTLLALPDGRLLASARTAHDQHLELFESPDAGRSWRPLGPVSLPMQITSHLLRLRDGRILLAYGNRCPNNFGVDARLSRDGGYTWGPPIRVADMPLSDGGYPSSVQLADGRVVTAYYNQVSGKFHYEMGVAIWDVNEFDKL
jgi:hypothetical protein